MKTNSIYYVIYARTMDIYDECNPDRDFNVQSEEGYPVIATTQAEADALYEEASKLSHDYGRELLLDLWKVHLTKYEIEDIAELEDEDDIKDYIKDIYYNSELVKTETFDNNHYEPLAGGVVLTWSWNRYIGYSRNFIGVEWGDNIYNYATRSYAKTEKDIITSNGAYTNRNVSELIIKASDLENLSDQDKAEYIINEIMSDKWKWNYQQAPSATKIADALGLNNEDY